MNFRCIRTEAPCQSIATHTCQCYKVNSKKNFEMNENNSVSVSDFISSDKSQVFNCEVHLTQTRMTKCETDQIVNPYRLYVYGIDNVGWVSLGSNFVHKRKGIVGACSKLGGEMCTVFGGQT